MERVSTFASASGREAKGLKGGEVEEEKKGGERRRLLVLKTPEKELKKDKKKIKIIFWKCRKSFYLCNPKSDEYFKADGKGKKTESDSRSDK